MEINPVVKAVNDIGQVVYWTNFDNHWDGVDSLAQYLVRYWNAQLLESVDNIYTRRWVLRVSDSSIVLCHDGQLGNWFMREEVGQDQSLLEEIAADLRRRFGLDSF